MATTKLSRIIGTPTSGTTFTISAWVKGSVAEGRILTSIVPSVGNNTQTWVELQNSGAMRIANYIGSYNMQLITTRLFRDPSAWYHFVVAFDTTQGTDTNRVKLYVNGVQETSFSTTTYPSQNLVLKYGVSGQTFNVGAKDTDTYWNGLMSHVHFIDGTQYAASEFGETDSTTGEWKIKTSPSVTYGNNGFFILKDGNSVTDQSGNSNNFTVAGGTLTNTEDCPDNVFATLNPLNAFYTNDTFSNGNNTVVTGSSTTGSKATFVINTGKFYWEVKVISKTAGIDEYLVGIVGSESVATNNFVGQGSDGYGYYGASGAMYNNAASSSYGASYTAGDILGIALDCTNSKLYIHKNGTYQASGNPSASTGGLSIVAPSATGLGGYYPSATLWNTNSATFSYNFGNGYFGTTAVASAGTNASSNGVFEYDVPTGYTALSTKGLNL